MVTPLPTESQRYRANGLERLLEFSLRKAPLAKKVLAMGLGSAHKFAAPSTCWEVKWPGKPPFLFVDSTSTSSNNFRFKVSGALRAFVRISKIQTIALDPNNIIIRYGTNMTGIYGISTEWGILCACMFWLSFHFGPPPWYSYHPALLNLRPFDHQVQTHRANNVLSINSLPFKRYLTSGTFVPSYDIILWKSILS